MNKKEALRAMLDGKTVTSKLNGSTIKFFKGAFVYNQSEISINVDYFSEDSKWELYQEPKKKVRFYQFVGTDGKVTELFYTEDLKQYYLNGSSYGSASNSDKWIKTSNFIEVEI